MAQLWGGRFTKETDKLVYNFNASISFDQKFYKQDIQGSIAHVCMLGKQGILTKEEMQTIVKGLQGILEDYVKETGSEYGKEILKNFDSYIPDFKKLVPNDYQKMLTAISKFEEQGIDHDHAVLEAFKELA